MQCETMRLRYVAEYTEDVYLEDTVKPCDQGFIVFLENDKICDLSMTHCVFFSRNTKNLKNQSEWKRLMV